MHGISSNDETTEMDLRINFEDFLKGGEGIRESISPGLTEKNSQYKVLWTKKRVCNTS